MDSQLEKGVAVKTQIRIAPAEIFIHEMKGENIMSCRDRGMGGKNRRVPHFLYRVFETHTVFLYPLPDTLQ
jgi:hypothetical protein